MNDPKCYVNHRSAEEQLPRFSSGNLEQEEIGQPIMDVVLKAGDLLYFPRGTIHQANALPDSHSLHITLSCFQKNTWGDLLEKVRCQQNRGLYVWTSLFHFIDIN